MGGSSPELFPGEVPFPVEISRIQGKGKSRAGLSKIILKINYLILSFHLLCEESYSTGKYNQHLVIIYIGKEPEKEYIHIYVCMHTYIYM